jgi:septal ring factor EnvC (AmiA/AmiB activator)
MPDTELRERLEDLHAELERAPRVDPESRRLLAEVARDIDALLGRSPAPADAGGGEHATLTDRLSELVREFEEEHPALAAAVGRVATALANLGI